MQMDRTLHNNDISAIMKTLASINNTVVVAVQSVGCGINVTPRRGIVYLI